MKFQNLEIKTQKGKLKVLQILLENNNIIITSTLEHLRHISQSHPYWNVPVTLICSNPWIHGLDRKSRCRTMKFASVTKCFSASRTFFRRFPCTKGSSNIFWLLLRLIDWFRGTERVRAWSKLPPLTGNVSFATIAVPPTTPHREPCPYTELLTIAANYRPLDSLFHRKSKNLKLTP